MSSHWFGLQGHVPPAPRVTAESWYRKRTLTACKLLEPRVNVCVNVWRPPPFGTTSVAISVQEIGAAVISLV